MMITLRRNWVWPDTMRCDAVAYPDAGAVSLATGEHVVRFFTPAEGGNELLALQGPDTG